MREGLQQCLRVIKSIYEAQSVLRVFILSPASKARSFCPKGHSIAMVVGLNSLCRQPIVQVFKKWLLACDSEPPACKRLASDPVDPHLMRSPLSPASIFRATFQFTSAPFLQVACIKLHLHCGNAMPAPFWTRLCQRTWPSLYRFFRVF